MYVNVLKEVPLGDMLTDTQLLAIANVIKKREWGGEKARPPSRQTLAPTSTYASDASAPTQREVPVPPKPPYKRPRPPPPPPRKWKKVEAVDNTIMGTTNQKRFDKTPPWQQKS